MRGLVEGRVGSRAPNRIRRRNATFGGVTPGSAGLDAGNRRFETGKRWFDARTLWFDAGVLWFDAAIRGLVEGRVGSCAPNRIRRRDATFGGVTPGSAGLDAGIRRFETGKRWFDVGML